MFVVPVEQDLDAYAGWTARLWMSSLAGIQDRDRTIMSLGLGGETGEVMEVVEALDLGHPLDREWACKEMGDVMYYWARLGEAFGLRLRDIMAPYGNVAGEASSKPLTLDELAQRLATERRGILSCSVALGSRVGKVLEILKKRVRDDQFQEDQFAQAMGETGAAWCRLCIAMGLAPSEVLRANIDKIEDRKLRGVMRGNGNHR